MSEEAPRKKVLEISALDDSDNIIITEEDYDKSLTTIIMELAEAKQSEGQSLAAQQLRGLLENNRMFYNNRMINPNLKIGDLNFTADMFGGESVDHALIELEEAHSGGL